jgi:hypothetical protein
VFPGYADNLTFAEDAYALLVPLVERFLATVRGANEMELDKQCIAVGDCWFMLWEAIDRTAGIVTANGRDASEVAAIRAKIRDRTPNAISYQISEFHPTTFPPGRQVTYSLRGDRSVVFWVPELELARAALDAIARAVPEVVVPRAPVATLAPRSTSWMPMAIVIAVLLVAGGVLLAMMR